MAVRTGAPRPDISSVGALVRLLVNSHAVACTATGASGVHFVSVVDRLGITELIKAKAIILKGGSVGEVIANGKADVGIQLISELISIRGVDLIGPLPNELQNVIVFSAGILVGALHPSEAQELIKFLSTPSAKRIFRTKGLEPISLKSEQSNGM